jgi:hypothetical protein
MMSTLSLAVPTYPADPGDELAEDVKTFARCNATLGTATRLYLPDRRVTNLTMLRQKLFIARRPIVFGKFCLVSSIRSLSPFDAYRLPHGRSYQSGGRSRLARACTPWAEFADRTNRSTEP